MEILSDETTRCIKPLGRIDANTCHKLDAALEQFPDNDHDILIDLSACDYLSSAGIRVLLKAKKRMHSSSGTLYLAGVSAGVMQILETAGLQRVFQIEAKPEDAMKLMTSKHAAVLQPQPISSGGFEFQYQPFDIALATGYVWKESAIVSYRELGFGIGTGTMDETGNGQNQHPDLLFSSGHCVGFMPTSEAGEADFRVTNDPSRAGISLNEAISFGHQPAGVLRLLDPGQCSLKHISESVQEIKKELFDQDTLTFAVAINTDQSAPSISFIIQNDPSLHKVLRSKQMHQLEQIIASQEAVPTLVGITYHLTELELQPGDHSIPDQLVSHLTFENVLHLEASDLTLRLKNPVVLLFASHDLADGTQYAVSVETHPDYRMPPHYHFLARRLYSDSSRVIVKPLHGGYSAQTFQAESFDAQGRKMGPTVLKISGRDLISRESERCRKYALPYIFNNSAVVQGTDFFGDTGALRYNFVGIGGEESRLKWLTNYYHQEELDVLDPLFDKIFLTILKPWYGQPIHETIFPFRDHDPTFTFFPFIYDTINEVLSISANEQWIQIPESKQKVLNPYWFLKHEFARLRETGIPYFTGICHGDLNMQNILLDEKLNVYLIDFSETRPRSVVSDFARLEAIFMVDNAPLETDADYIDYLDFIGAFYAIERLDEMPVFHYAGRHQEKIQKNTTLYAQNAQVCLRQHRRKSRPHPLLPCAARMGVADSLLQQRPFTCKAAVDDRGVEAL
jgi:anti-anti-sigma factor